MAARAKSPAMPVAQSREEAEASIARLGVIQRELTRIQADLGDRVAKAKEASEAKASPLKDEAAQLQTRVQGWCEANRAALTRDNQVKFAILNTGEVKWRLRPPKVSVRNIEVALNYCRELLNGRFIRVAEDLDKEAIRADPTAASVVPGVTIGSEGEDFVIEPFDAALSVAVAPQLEAA